MSRMKVWAVGLLAATLLGTVACSIEIFEPDYHSWDTYRIHNDYGRSRCSSCHSTVVHVHVGDPGCWGCH